ncbi:uncharacterized protein LOC116845069 isoform X3 [Odontomachus brunneus]|uniref:uncharacterized protein LOC116845069 isoform X3 n=1 Tax=Odontomachus brunneus TaxID=486640 RepID=UPI0013F2AA75|nr:uncharacterized protein LOC116845069 isoform X3 [Odontomachus brunneus]
MTRKFIHDNATWFESDVELRNVFQQIFMECDTSMTYSTLSLSNEVPISKIVRYVQEQLPIWSLKHMLELWKCLSNVSTNDECVNLRQFKEATKCWIAKMLQTQTQDDNNNIEKEFYKNTNDTTIDSMKTKMDKDIVEVELRMRLREFDEENIILRDELARAEESIANFERQCSDLENRLDRYTKRSQDLERENDEQKDKLNEMMKNEKNYVSAYQKSTKKYESLSKQLEAAEIENQAIQPLQEKLEKINKEKRDCIKQVARLQEELCEKEEECEKFKVMIAELQDTNSSTKDIYEITISNLHEKNRQLMDANTELLSMLQEDVESLSMFQGERFLLSPIPNADGYHPHSTPYKLEKAPPPENSLYAELRASGFTAECSSTVSCRLELEEKLEYCDSVISTTLEQLNRIISNLAATSDSIDAFELDLPSTEDARVSNIETLKHKVTFLLNMVTEKIARNKNTEDSSTQLRADCSDVLESSEQFGIMSFRAGLTRTNQWPKPETDSRSISSQDVSDNNKDDPFMKVIRANAKDLDHNIVEIIDPIFDELDRIIEQTINSPVYKDLPVSENSRYRSKYTLPLSLQASSPNAENTEQATSCQNSIKNSLDAAFASGDGLTRRNCGGKSAELRMKSTRDVPGREWPPHPEESGPSEMSKVSSALQMDTKALATSTETNAKNFQAPEVTVTSPLTSPRRKFSVYSRSFDVVEVREPRDDDQGPCLEVRRSLSNSSIRGDKKAESGDEVVVDNETTANDRAHDQNGARRYLFSHSYRNSRHDSDSSNSCSPQKQFWDGSPNDELSPVAQPEPRKVYLAPTRLQLPWKIESASGETVDSLVAGKNTKDCVASATDSSESDVVPSSFSTVADDGKYERNGDASVHSFSAFAVDKCETVVDAALESNSRSVNEKFFQGHLTSAHAIPHNQIDPAKITDPEDPHPQRSVRQVDDDQPSRIERSVDSQMSSREDTSAGEDSECESAKPSDRCVDEGVTMGANEADQTADAVLPLIGSPMRKKTPCENAVQHDGRARDRNLFDAKQERRQRRLMMRRSFSEGDTRALCRCRQHDGPQTVPLIQTDNQFRSFPSLTNDRLQESGIANLMDTEMNNRENLSEFELQKKYTAFSLCLCTDRVTLLQRMELSLRQRDQSERNLACEVQKMQQDIQELAPLCTDRESVERVERVRHQLDMVARCAHRVSCTAETLGAIHQEHRVSRAVFLGDRYLQLLQSRCEKLAINVAETKRILMENNIVIEENSGELGDDLPRIRYRSGTPANNRMMDTVRQRNSVSGRMTLRRPSLNYESSKWENERLGRTDSSSSISELRGIFEHAESRRSSREENNNMLRLSQSNSQSIINCAIIDDEIWTNSKQETCSEFLRVDEDVNRDCRQCARLLQSFQLRDMAISWRVILWGILTFFFGFYVNRIVSDPSDQSMIERIFKRYFRTKNVTPHPT